MSLPVAAALLGGTARQVSKIAARTLRQRMAKRAAIEAGGVAKVAAVLVAEAQEVLVRAVVYERARGVSWADIGKALGVSRQSVYEKYSEAERAWKILSVNVDEDFEEIAARIERLHEVLGPAGRE